MVTRSTHIVRVTNPADTHTWIDMEVLDIVAFIGPNKEEFIYNLSAGKAKPCIVDNTGAGSIIGDPGSCSRRSHMEKLVGIDDSAQMIDIEVLDAIALRGPNGAEFLLHMPKAGITEAVIDNTGNGLDVDVTRETTRITHITEFKELKDGTVFCTDDPSENSGAKATGRILLTKRVDGVAFTGPNNVEWLMVIPKAHATTKDTTAYNPDGSPPENTDPDLYIRWPKGSAGPWVSGTGAPNVIAAPDAPVVSQGPFWWIGKGIRKHSMAVFQFTATWNSTVGDMYVDDPALTSPDPSSSVFASTGFSLRTNLRYGPLNPFWTTRPFLDHTSETTSGTVTIIDFQTYVVWERGGGSPLTELGAVSALAACTEATITWGLTLDQVYAIPLSDYGIFDGDKRTHDETVWTTSTTDHLNVLIVFDLGKIRTLLGAGHIFSFKFSTAASLPHGAYIWGSNLSTYDKIKIGSTEYTALKPSDVVVDSKNLPTGPTWPGPINRVDVNSDGLEGLLPAYTTTYTVDLEDLTQVTGSKVRTT